MAEYKMPKYPVHLFKMPIADDGDKTIPPDEASDAGRASLPEGFPQETQLPLTAGGVAPNRLDFQGMFYMLSAFAFWQQSGGMFKYNKELNYTTPAVVYHENELWWCEKDNGPATEAGPQEPGAEGQEGEDVSQYWTPLFSKISGGNNGGGLVPVGTVICGWWQEAPDGYLALDGGDFDATKYPKLAALLNNPQTLPDLRGYFIRGYDPNGVTDPNGKTRALGSKQTDAIRNITAHWICDSELRTGSCEGSIYYIRSISRSNGASNHSSADSGEWGFDASRVVPTAAENRPVNVCLLYCIKHD